MSTEQIYTLILTESIKAIFSMLVNIFGEVARAKMLDIKKKVLLGNFP